MNEEEQKQNEEQKWMNNYNLHHKNSEKLTPKQNNIAGSFCLPIKKNDYSSAIDITFISNIVLHVVAISTFNKDNDWCGGQIKQWWVF